MEIASNSGKTVPPSPKLDQRHDFTAKLRQESVLPRVISYVKWQRAVNHALLKGNAPPEMPVDFGPLSMNLDMTTACNYACGHCIDWDILNSPVKYAHEKLLSSLSQLIERGLRSVILIGGGEPTLYPRFGDTVRFLKERNIQVAVVSNGSRNEKIREVAHLFTPGDWVRLSLDSAYDQTFQAMHQPKQNVSLEEICAGVPGIREKNPGLQIGFSFIVTWRGAESAEKVSVVPNIDEIVPAAKLAHDSGFSYFSAKPFLRRSPEGGEVMDTGAIEDYRSTIARIRIAINEAKKLETPTFNIVESTNLRLLESDTWRDFTKQPNTCHMQALRQVLSPRGLYNCPAHRGVGKAFIAGKDAYADTGSVAKTQEATTSILRHFNAEHECREVTCLYKPVNDWIEDAIKSGINPEELEAVADRGDYFL
ncbi:MAG: radical SAM protein [Patescibacteria group bacterium]